MTRALVMAKEEDFAVSIARSRRSRREVRRLRWRAFADLRQPETHLIRRGAEEGGLPSIGAGPSRLPGLAPCQ
jgi:hypothetical protein